MAFPSPPKSTVWKNLSRNCFIFRRKFFIWSRNFHQNFSRREKRFLICFLKIKQWKFSAKHLKIIRKVKFELTHNYYLSWCVLFAFKSNRLLFAWEIIVNWDTRAHTNMTKLYILHMLWSKSVQLPSSTHAILRQSRE